MTGPHSPNPYVFVVGCQRSGTTLTERILDAHPQIAMTHETRWIPELYERRPGVTATGLPGPELLAALLEHDRFRHLGMSADQLEQLFVTDRPVTYAEFVSSVFDLYGRERGKRLAGDKTPRYVRCIELLHGLWPAARFVHVVRDGRDVYASRKAMDLRRDAPRQDTWREHPALSAGLWWTANVRVGRESGASLGPALYHELRYEALVADPERECVRLCAFLGLPYEPEMLRFNERTHNLRPVATRSSGSTKRLPVTAGLRDWRSELSPGEISAFEATAGDLLDELGYERSGLAADERTLVEAVRVRHEFSRRMRGQRRPLPRHWEDVSAEREARMTAASPTASERPGVSSSQLMADAPTASDVAPARAWQEGPGNG